MVPGLAFANSIKPMSMARIPMSEMPGYEGPEKIMMGPSIQGPNGMSSQDLVPIQMPRPMEGIGGLFQNQFQQYGSELADLQGSPLKNYQNYLMATYGKNAMENVQNNVQEDVNTFVDLVDQAERAHCGAEESFGYGGGEYHKGMMDKFQNNLPQPLDQLGGAPKRGFEGGSQADTLIRPVFEGFIEAPTSATESYYQLFRNGGEVTPSGIDFYKQYAPFRKETP